MLCTDEEKKTRKNPKAQSIGQLHDMDSLGMCI